MKIILDMPTKEMGGALPTLFQTIPRYPDQKIGTSNGIKTPNGYYIIRNQDSYTVKYLGSV